MLADSALLASALLERAGDIPRTLALIDSLMRQHARHRLVPVGRSYLRKAPCSRDWPLGVDSQFQIA